MKKIRIAVVGYGNVGRGVLKAIEKNPDTVLVAIFTRRISVVGEEIRSVPIIDSNRFNDFSIADVAILCGGSKEDLPVQGPKFAKNLNTVDSFDTHKNIPEYFKQMNAFSRAGQKVAVVSAGWDPGIFSLERVFADAFIPDSKTYTFWGRGVSQGHSDAARKIKGVLDARQYTIPIAESMEKVRNGETPIFTKREMHKRVVYVVAEKGADRARISQEIASMPNYFDEYETEVIFITEEQMTEEHSAYSHSGFVLTSGKTGNNHKQILEYGCQLENNPEFTGSVLVACARAAFRLNKEGKCGAFTMFDIPPCYFSSHSSAVLRETFM